MSIVFEILTVQEVADRLRLKPSWVYANADKLGAYRVGKYLVPMGPCVGETRVHRQRRYSK